MRRNTFLLVIILLVTAAGAAVTYALTVPSIGEKSLKAYFVSPDIYESRISGHRQEVLDPDALRFEGERVPYDAETNTVYIPQSLHSEEWEGSLSATLAGAGLCITCRDEQEDGIGQSDLPDKKESIADNRIYKVALITEDHYMEGKLIFTGLPAVLITHNDGEIEFKEKHSGKITVIDPYRREHSESACSFHVRGNTSVYFDKKSYRITLQDSVGSKNKLSYLGMREDDDWVLNSLSTDLTLSREKVCYDLWQMLNEMEEAPVPSASIEYAELFLNQSYRGVYGLMTPVDAKLMNMKQGDLLYKINTWEEEITAPGKLTDYNGQPQIFNENGFEYAQIEYPGSLGGEYIWDPMEAYQDFVYETRDPAELKEKGVALDKENFILHELFCEMTRAADNTWKNTYLAARKDENGMYTFSETIWDLNYTFGDQFKWNLKKRNTVFNKKSSSEYKLRFDRGYGYTTLAAVDPDVFPRSRDKWNMWRENGIGPELLTEMFEKERKLLADSGALLRNEQKWEGSTAADYPEIYSWISERFRFFDAMYDRDE